MSGRHGSKVLDWVHPQVMSVPNAALSAEAAEVHQPALSPLQEHFPPSLNVRTCLLLLDTSAPSSPYSPCLFSWWSCLICGDGHISGFNSIGKAVAVIFVQMWFRLPTWLIADCQSSASQSCFLCNNAKDRLQSLLNMPWLCLLSSIVLRSIHSSASPIAEKQGHGQQTFCYMPVHLEVQLACPC